MSSRIVPVSLIVSYVKELLDGDPLSSDVWVEGDVAQVFRARSGHVYFTLKDGDSALKAVMFRTLAERQRLLPTAGERLVAHGRISLYERDGTVQLYADVTQAAGLGVLALQFEQLRQRLDAEGLFAIDRKRPIPARPRAIGVVTSADGSVWHDIQQVLQRRFPLVEVVLASSMVQGVQAPAQLVQALEAIQRQRRVDVVIIGRGGGSADDLSAFNDEGVARAVFACRVPVISAVGHETDWAMTDWVADARAATPSVAAELCVPSRVDLLDQLVERRDALTRHATSLTRESRQHLSYQRSRLARVDLPATIRRQRHHTDHQRDALARCGRAAVEARRGSLARQRSVLQALAPTAVLDRGYALVSDVEGAGLIASRKMAVVHLALRLHFRDGEMTVRPDVTPRDVAASNGRTGAAHAS